MSIRRRLRHVSAMVAFTVVAVPALAIVAPSTGVAADDQPLRVVGSVPTPNGPPKDPNGQAKVLGIDPVRHRMFYEYPDGDGGAHLVTYDISGRIPRQIAIASVGRDADFNIATRYTVAFDPGRQELAIVTPSMDPGTGTLPAGPASILVYSDRTHSVRTRWSLATSLPGFFPLGISYSAKDDRIYAVGEFTAVRNLADGTVIAGAKFMSPGTAVVALDPLTGKPTWVRSLASDCPQVLYSKSIGSLIARSGSTDALYFACVSGGTPAAQTYPGATGLVRMHIDPKGDSAAQADQPVEYFAISGNYFSGGSASGIAAFDAHNERFYLQSLSFTTPGAWVFDGRLTAWVGFVSAPSSADYYIGVNERLGHLYIGTYRINVANNGLLVADVRQTPVPAGEFTPLITTALIAADSASNRLFIRPENPNAHWLVLEDLTPASTYDQPTEDYDALTTGLPDSPSNDVDYALGATGFGAEAIQVGGTGAPLTALGTSFGNGIPGVASGTRAVMAGRVGYLDLRPSGAGAAAQAATADTNTVQYYESDDRYPRDGKPDTWPYKSLACLDTGGQPQSQSDSSPDISTDGATASISCDLAKSTVKASSIMSAAGSGGAQVQRSTYDVTATRDSKTGGVVDSTATATGVSFQVEGGYTVSFGRVVSKALSRAHGHQGTAYSEWSRSVEGVSLVGPDGKSLLPEGAGCYSYVKAGLAGNTRDVHDTCATLSTAINKLLPTRFHADFPMPDVITTPKGAFAAIEQTSAQYYQQNVVNDQGVIYKDDSVGIRPTPAVIAEAYQDTAERSRTVTVLAATQTNVRYTISPPYDDGWVDGGGGGTSSGSSGGGAPVVNPGHAPATTADAPPPVITNPAPTASGPLAALRGFLLRRRGLRDALLLVLLSGLVVGGSGTVFRRRRLVDVLVTVPRKEAL